MSIIVGRVGLGVDLESNPFDRQLNALGKKGSFHVGGCLFRQKTGRLREILH